MIKKYLTGWIIFFFLFIFLAKLIKLILVFPVNIILVFFGLNPETAPYVSEYGSLILNIVLSFLLYKWTIDTFVVPRIVAVNKPDNRMHED
jgi:hypothetical protein